MGCRERIHAFLLFRATIFLTRFGVDWFFASHRYPLRMWHFHGVWLIAIAGCVFLHLFNPISDMKFRSPSRRLVSSRIRQLLGYDRSSAHGQKTDNDSPLHSSE